MKKLVHTIFFTIFVSGVISGQDLIYTISGELNKNKVPINSILIENLTNNTWISFNDLPDESYYQINLTKKSYWGTTNLAIFGNDRGFIETQNSPGLLTLSYRNNIPAEVKISIYMVSGKLIYSAKRKILNDGNSLKVQVGSTGIFLVKIDLPFVSQTFKVIGSQSQKSFEVDVVDEKNHTQLIKSALIPVNADFSYSIGDNIRISVSKDKCYAESKETIVAEGKSINFIFEQMLNSSVLVRGNVKIDGVPNFNFSGLTVESTSNKSPIMINGSFQVPNEINDNELLPLLIMKGEEIMFGFYPKSPLNNSVTLDDILLFHFKLFPDITSLNLTNEKLLELIHTDSNYKQLLTVLGETLNANVPPADNQTYIEVLSASANSISTIGEIPGVFTGYTYFVTNFDDGWSATPKTDFVEISKAGTTVLFHYGVTLTDELRLDVANNCWSLFSGSRYVVNNLYPYNYSAANFPYYYLQADVTVKASGENKFVSFLVQTVNGVAYGYEVISNSSAEFLQKFPTIESIQNMYSYNKFALGANDLIGTWQEGSGSFTQYYYVQSGNYAGMNIVVSNLKYMFVNSSDYNTDVKSVSSAGYQKEKEIGKYVVNNWEISTTDQNGKVSDFNAWFEAVKGGRILHLWNKQFTGEHYQLGRIK